jgi:hypothetical protein
MPQIELDKILANVSKNRRGFFKALLVGSAVVASPAMISKAMAAGGEGEPPKPDGTCNGDLIVSKKTGTCVAKKKKEGG